MKITETSALKKKLITREELTPGTVVKLVVTKQGEKGNTFFVFCSSVKEATPQLVNLVTGKLRFPLKEEKFSVYLNSSLELGEFELE